MSEVEKKLEELFKDALSKEVVHQLLATNALMNDIFETVFKDLHPSIFFSIIPALIDMYCEDRNIDEDVKRALMLDIIESMAIINK